MKQQALLSDDEIIVGHAILEPGEKRAPEIHSDMSETIVVLRGELAVHGQTSTARPCSRTMFVFVGAGVEHQVQNASATEPAEFLAIMRKVPT